MLIGRMRSRLILQSATLTQSDSGAESETWADLASVWGEIHPLNSREFFAAQSLQSEVTGWIRIRFLSAVQNQPDNYRIKYGSRIFDILSAIDPEERGEELILRVREKAG